MNNDLEKLREKIDAVDEKLMDLLKERFHIVKEIKAHKQKNQVKVLDNIREKTILSKTRRYSHFLEMKNIYLEIFKNSKNLQYDKQFGILGKNLHYSQSKELTNSFFEMNNLNYKYLNIELEEEELETFFNKIIRFKFEFINVTIPYKEAVLKYLDCVEDSVRNTHACNLIIVKEGKLIGYNTDYLSLVEMLKKYPLQNRKCYVLGSGGAGKACYQAIKELSGDCFVVTRNKEKLLEMDYKCFFNKKIISYEELENQKDLYLIVNATPVGTTNKNESILSKNIVEKAEIGFDLVYNPYDTLFLSYCQKEKIYGLELLYLQNKKALEIYGFDNSFKYVNYKEFRGGVINE